MSTNINNTQVNDVVDKKRYLDSNSNLSNDRDKYPQLVVTLDIKIGKKVWVAYYSGMTCLWDSRAPNNIVKEKK